MDFVVLCFYIALSILPFTIYSLCFKPDDSRRSSLYRDWFYLVKLYFAKSAVRSYQEKHRQKVKRQKNRNEFNFPTHKHSIYQYMQGVDQKGNNLTIKFTVLYEKISEVYLFLRVENGDAYVFPGERNVQIQTIKPHQWRTNGLNIEVLEPFKRFRLVFNGLLHNLSKNLVQHVQFNFIFNSCGRPMYYPQDVDTTLLADSIATEIWKDGSWKTFLSDQLGYQQFGTLLGFIKGDSFKDDLIVNLPTCRSFYSGVDDRFVLERQLNIFLADNEGVLITIVIKSFRNGCSQLNYGFAIHKDYVVVPIKGLDIRLKHIANDKNIPDAFVAHIKVEGKVYKCAFYLNKNKATKAVNHTKYGWELFNVPAECDINHLQGRAVLEFWYPKKGKFSLEDLPSPLLSEKIVSKIPDILVTNINSEDAKISALTGGKGCSLALLTSLKSQEFSVPPGFVLTINAFRRQLNENRNLKQLVIDLDDICCGRKFGKLEDACARTVDAFKTEPLDVNIVDAVKKELNKVKETIPEEHSISWAVRSSAIGEDSEELSAAGQNETFLGCFTEEEVLKSVQACWASLFTYQSVQYRWQHGSPVMSDMAVVVQKMVPADSAGVLFTWHPSTCDPSKMVVTSNYGLGESVVSGKSDPDTIILKRTWNEDISILERQVGTKNMVIKMTDRGIKEEKLEDGEDFEVVGSEQLSITDSQGIKLGEVGVSLENNFGGPRDIEWAFYKDRLYLLQSRPITTVNAWSEFELAHEFDVPVLSENNVYTVANTGEVFPDAVTVLTRTVCVDALEHALQRRLYKEIDPYVSKCLSGSQFRVMIDVITGLHKMTNKKIKASSKILDLAVFGHPVIDERINEKALNTFGEVTTLKHIRETVYMLNKAWKSKEIVENMKTTCANFDVGITSSDSSLEMFEKIERNIEMIIDSAFIHVSISGVCVFYQILALSVLLEGGEELKTDHYSDIASILSTCDDVVSAEVPATLEKIASVVRKTGLSEEFILIEPSQGVTWLEEKCPEAYKLLKEFLKRHGHRVLREFELMEESWAADPSKVIPMIQANAKQESRAEKKIQSADEVIQGLESPKSQVTRRILKFLIGKMRVGVGRREQTKSESIRLLDKVKKAYRQLAEKMVLEGILPSKDLVFHLSQYELKQLITQKSPLLITKAVQRQRLLPKWSKARFSEVVFGLPKPEQDDVDLDYSGKVCTGTPVCNGTVKARACVITKLDEIHQLQPGDILITYSTDIGWSPYFPMLSGVVTELGGLVSHGAVVAREYGLPCVVGIRNVTKLFKTGDIVLLSGKTGELGKVDEKIN